MSGRVKRFFILKIFVLVFIAVSIFAPLPLREAQGNVFNKVRAKWDYLKAIAKGGYYEEMFIAKAYNKLVDVLYHEALEHRDKIRRTGRQYFIQKKYTFEIPLPNGEKTKIVKTYAFVWDKLLKNNDDPIDNLRYANNNTGIFFYDQTFLQLKNHKWIRMTNMFTPIYIENNHASIDVFGTSQQVAIMENFDGKAGILLDYLENKESTKEERKNYKGPNYITIDGDKFLIDIELLDAKAAEKIREEYGY